MRKAVVEWEKEQHRAVLRSWRAHALARRLHWMAVPRRREELMRCSFEGWSYLPYWCAMDRAATSMFSLQTSSKAFRQWHRNVHVRIGTASLLERQRIRVVRRSMKIWQAGVIVLQHEKQNETLALAMVWRREMITLALSLNCLRTYHIYRRQKRARRERLVRMCARISLILRRRHCWSRWRSWARRTHLERIFMYVNCLGLNRFCLKPNHIGYD